MVPKPDIGIPNFIVIGSSKVQGKVVYSNKANIRILQCASCISEEHLMTNPICPGIKEWGDYCDEYDKKMEEARLVPSVVEKEKVGGEAEEDN